MDESKEAMKGPGETEMWLERIRTPLLYVHSKYKASTSSQLETDWKQEETTSMALSTGNQIGLPAPLGYYHCYILFV